MPALKRTGSAVSKSGLPPPSKVGRSHGPLEEEDDDVFFEGQPKSDDKMDVDLAPPQKKQATNKKTKPTTGHRPISSYFNEPIKVPSTPPISHKLGRKTKIQDVSPEASSSEITTSGAAPKTRAEKRSAKRQEKPAKDAREKRKLSAAAAQDEILAVEWFSQVAELLSRSRTIDNIINVYDPDASIAEQKSMLRTLFNTTCDLDSVERVPDDSPFWTIFANMDAATTRFFFSLARGLQLADIQQAVDAGVLRLSPLNDPKPVVGNLSYIRVGDCQSPLDAGRACLVASPSDTPRAMVRLLELGMSLDDVEVCVGEVLEPFGHRGAVQPLFSRLKDETTVESLPRFAEPQLWEYSGVSHEKQPSGRHADDEAAARQKGLHSRFATFLRENAGRCSWRCYEILPLHLPNSAGIRVDPVAGAVEKFIIAMQAGRGLNSAIGGFFRLYIPPPALSSLFSSLPPAAYGLQPTSISDRVHRLYEDERVFLSQYRTPIPDPAFQSASKNAGSVLRTNGHSVPYLRLMKDLTQEAFVGTNKSVWEAGAGPGPQLFLHLMSLLDPAIRREGDLSEDEIARLVGSSADFWRLVTGQPDYWLHALWTTRLCITVDPVVVSIWSHVMFSAFALGSLHLVWEGIPDSTREVLISGQTPVGVHEFLPPSHGNSYWHPLCGHDTYVAAVGSLFIARYGPNPAHLALLIPNLHCGLAKYRPLESFLVETIILIVSAIERIALDHVQRLHDQGINPDRTDKERAWEYFRLIKAEVESDVTYVALKLELETVKGKYAQRTTVRAHLDSLAHPNPSHSSRASPASPAAAPYEIPGITRTSELGSARLAQLDIILAHISSLTDGGFPVDAFGLVPFHLRNRIHSPEFRAWFLSLPAGIRISASAREQEIIARLARIY
ncbi:hypothetical protein DFH09DRAFT_1408288 [Mycena vulgaris]|nr:hypothetical protein DFH09DRAFT_1408288 [Mycena vulgaris]